MSDYIQIEIPVGSGAMKDLVIAKLVQIGFEGFEEERTTLKAFIPQADFDELLLKKTIGNHGAGYSVSIIKQQNWNEIWEAGFEPVVVDDFCGIRAEFHLPIKGVRHEIVITPKMSFGTGHHATTYMMIKALEKSECVQKRVFDFGTGTGVLAILAEKLGAAKIDAIDNDDWSIENAKENFERNNCHRIRLYKSASLPDSAQYDIVLANINKNVILSNLESIKEGLLPGGIVLISGFLEDDVDEVETAASRHQLSVTEKQVNSSWVCLRLLLQA